MSYLQSYLYLIRNRGNHALADSIKNTAEEIGEKYIQTFDFISNQIGLLFGNVQSGKTGQMFGIICKATDLGFPVFLLLTTDNVTLQQQTLQRVKDDLSDYCICGENDAQLFANNELLKPVIVVLKKNSRILKLWANIFKSTGFMRGNPLFIVDDEADAASLNTRVNQNEQSSINRYLSAIREDASGSLYLQVTGTPQGIFLQSLESGFKPLFTAYFKPGAGYLGGDFFFPATEVSKCIKFNDTLTNLTRDVVIQHLLTSAQLFLSGEKVCNCLFHPSVRQTEHKKLATAVITELKWCKDNWDRQFLEAVKSLYTHMAPEKSAKRPLEEILAKIKDLLLGNTIKVLIMNGATDVEASEYSIGCNFIVGGNTLGRGVTFPKLQTICYSRSSKSPQADTMWQHSRMFGYDRDPGLMKLFIDQHLHKLFTDINSNNNSIIKQIESGLDSIKLYFPEGLNPTRKNIIDNQKVSIITGGTNYYPFALKNDTYGEISKLLEPFDPKEPYYQVNINLIKTLLTKITSESAFPKEAFLSFLQALQSEHSILQGILIVRTNRDITQGTGALLSPNDWNLGNSFTDKVVLTMYQVNGTKGWGGKPLWVPNIKFPESMNFYNIEE